MANAIKFVIDTKGNRKEVIIPIEIWEKVSFVNKKIKNRVMDSKKLSKYFGLIRQTIDPIRFQRLIRSEWD